MSPSVTSARRVAVSQRQRRCEVGAQLRRREHARRVEPRDVGRYRVQVAGASEGADHQHHHGWLQGHAPSNGDSDRSARESRRPAGRRADIAHPAASRRRQRRFRNQSVWGVDRDAAASKDRRRARIRPPGLDARRGRRRLRLAASSTRRRSTSASSPRRSRSTARPTTRSAPTSSSPTTSARPCCARSPSRTSSRPTGRPSPSSTPGRTAASAPLVRSTRRKYNPGVSEILTEARRRAASA